MYEVILGSLVALAIRDVVYELVERYNARIRRKNFELLMDQLEDLEADDD